MPKHPLREHTMGVKHHGRREEKSRVAAEEDSSQTAARKDTFFRIRELLRLATRQTRSIGEGLKDTPLNNLQNKTDGDRTQSCVIAMRLRTR